jgi:hypothetical protein
MAFRPMATLINRTLSLAVYVGYLVTAYHYSGGLLTVKIAIALLLAMACIWFPEELGQYTGIMHYHAITSPTPLFFGLRRRLVDSAWRPCCRLLYHGKRTTFVTIQC